MFIETHIKNKQHGCIEVICGSMFSGKTEELIRRLKRAKIANQKVGIFKPAVDTRYHEENITSHDTNAVKSIPVKNAEEILNFLHNDYEVVAIDEAQFFDDKIADVCETIANKGLRVIVAGLDLDFKAQPFGAMPSLLAKADYVTKLHAICTSCGNIAYVSYRKSKSGETVLLGEKDIYEPLCRKCYLENKVS